MPAEAGVPTLGKRERELSPASDERDTAAVTPADCESAQEFFSHFLGTDKTASSYPDFISISSNIFEPGKFVARAVDAANEYIASHGGIDDALLTHMAADVDARSYIRHL